MTDSDVETVKGMMEDCRLLTDSDCESFDLMDWTFLGGHNDDTSSMDCISDDDFLVVQHRIVESLAHQATAETEVVLFNRFGIRNPKEITIADIVKENALPLLPAKTLCMLRSVCKAWNAWISTPFLAHKQALFFRQFSGLICQSPMNHRSSFISIEPTTCGIPDPDLNFLPIFPNKVIRSTCNGLVCCQGSAQDSPYYICNPVTEQCHSLPPPNYFHWPGTVVVLAFEPSTFNFNSNYELVCAIPTEMGDDDAIYITFAIFSSRSRSWRVCENMCTDFIGTVRLMGKGFYSHGVVYWETEGGCLLALDLRTEEHGTIKLPEGSGPQCALSEIHGEICYMMPDKESCRVLVFAGMKMSLKCTIDLELGYSLQDFDYFGVLGCVDGGDVLLILLDDIIIAYHTVEKTHQTLKYFVEDAQELEFFPYVNSLVNANSPPLKNN